MELSDYVSGFRDELTSITRFAGPEKAEAARMLAEALEPAFRLTLLEVLSAAAAEVTQRLDGVAVDVRLSSGSPEFVVTSAPGSAEDAAGPPASSAEGADDAGTARITLRLPEGLKARIDTAAAADGVSVNSWLVQAARRGLDDRGAGGRRRGGFGIGQRMTGYARG
jgi:HicB family